jgi:poly(beta-D-mannuronate) lyase
VYLGNTFLNCAGTLTLRQGNRCEVKNNVFLGGDTPGAGGIRVTGEGHTLSGNFFSGTKGRGGGAISLIAGAEEPQRGSYHQVKSCLIQGNTFVDNPGTLFALDARLGGQGSTLLPEDVLVSDNLMVAAEEAESPISAKVPPVGIQWKENVLVGAAHTLGVLEGITLVNDIPEPLRVRTRPTPLTHRDVGPGWIRQQTALDL